MVLGGASLKRKLGNNPIEVRHEIEPEKAGRRRAAKKLEPVPEAEAEIIREQLELICASRFFCLAELRQHMLRLIVERTITGISTREKDIATVVYEKDAAFKSEDSTIARGEKSKLKRKLRQYYDETAAGRNAPLEIKIGVHCAFFVKRRLTVPETMPVELVQPVNSDIATLPPPPFERNDFSDEISVPQIRADATAEIPGDANNSSAFSENVRGLGLEEASHSHGSTTISGLPRTFLSPPNRADGITEVQIDMGGQFVFPEIALKQLVDLGWHAITLVLHQFAISGEPNVTAIKIVSAETIFNPRDSSLLGALLAPIALVMPTLGIPAVVALNATGKALKQAFPAQPLALSVCISPRMLAECGFVPPCSGCIWRQDGHIFLASEEGCAKVRAFTASLAR